MRNTSTPLPQRNVTIRCVSIGGGDRARQLDAAADAILAAALPATLDTALCLADDICAAAALRASRQRTYHAAWTVLEAAQDALTTTYIDVAPAPL